MKTEKGKGKKQPPAEMPTSLFLQKDMVAPGEKAVVYSIENELVSAGKNRGLALYLSLGLFALLLLAAPSASPRTSTAATKASPSTSRTSRTSTCRSFCTHCGTPAG
jgi:hypothetical protein